MIWHEFIWNNWHESTWIDMNWHERTWTDMTSHSSFTMNRHETPWIDMNRHELTHRVRRKCGTWNCILGYIDWRRLIAKNHAERFPKKRLFFGIFVGSFLVRPWTWSPHMVLQILSGQKFKYNPKFKSLHEVGGKHLRATGKYPGDFGLAATWF